MELLVGEILRDVLARSPFQPREAVETAVAIAQGVSAAHSKSITYRDLKPRNIFLV
jgi:serine/threonine protein kinase